MQHRLDPAYRTLVDTAPSYLTRDALPQRRALARQSALEAASTGLREDGKVILAQRFVRSPHGAEDIRVLIYAPTDTVSLPPVLVHMHGGGMVMGSPESADARNRRLVSQAGCAIVSVDYRLAPEAVFPASIEDCYAVLKWVYANAADIGVDRSRIALGGESAGGGLAASLALLARDRAEVPVVFQLLTYPMLDDRTGTTVKSHPAAGEFMWSSVSNRFGWSALLGCEPGGECVSAYAAAARAIQLGGLPPAFIAVGTLDLFVEENIAYANRLICAGVPTELHVYPGAPHGFETVDAAHASEQYWLAATLALRRALHE